ncbi:hypothetical protein GCM10010252_17650 [Streptomyces aureoverticillatus]|nr:hypothetical protein GCM10010252_17650 [Streptomyces aureoverticillatus]
MPGAGESLFPVRVVDVGSGMVVLQSGLGARAELGSGVGGLRSRCFAVGHNPAQWTGR